MWKADDVGEPESWTDILDDSARDTLVAAAVAMRDSGVTLATATRVHLDAEAMRPFVARWREELQHGRGFVLVRNFPVDLLDEETIELAYFALGLQLGQPVSQDASGTLLGHVRDQGVPRTDPSIRRYATNERQDFDTDGADIVGPLCLQRAIHGGESRLASAAAVAAMHALAFGAPRRRAAEHRQRDLRPSAGQHGFSIVA